MDIASISGIFGELDRLYGNEKTTSRQRPQYYGHSINKYIYDPIEHGYLKSKLNELNIDEKGKRIERFKDIVHKKKISIAPYLFDEMNKII